jgi:hypothetical protein
MFKRKNKTVDQPLVSEDEVPVVEVSPGMVEPLPGMEPKHFVFKGDADKDAERVRKLEAAIKAHRDIGRATYEHSPKGTVELIPRHVHETLWNILD